ncbi:M23 family metallopeptidase [Glycomyces buryatensis]|uniref:M23 family metallopeptidase n=1 Tax=Glycomyces buryatensis TaxID=2570927 RepID=A0A4V4HSN4_9ACTN|nr:M23 family metallopeptidase [Glycomyces buryatensis]THV42296.1 M23 family metallopeptidase [Glycomyces buryatensis]
MSDTGLEGAVTVRRHAARPHRTRGQHRASWAAELTPILSGTQRRYTAVVGSAVTGASIVALATAAGMPSGEPDPAASQAVADIAALAAEAETPEESEQATSEAATPGEPGAEATAEQETAEEEERTSPVTPQAAQVEWTAPLDSVNITSLFGQRWGRNHNGIDFAAETGTPVYTVYPGTVKHAGWESGFGNLVIIDHGDGVETYYAHNSEINVSEGDWVDMGDQIANAGNTGFSFGSHVHFEVHVDGEPVEPLGYLDEAGLSLG